MEDDKIHRCPQNKKNILYTFGEKEKHKEYSNAGNTTMLVFSNRLHG